MYFSLSCFWFSSLPAHEQKAAFTEIFFNERTGNLEVAHRFSIHDAEHTLRKAVGLQAELIESKDDQSTFADYVADRFQLVGPDKNRISLTLIGQELDRGYLWIYQETRIQGAAARSFHIENSVMMDVVEGQINTVNVRDRGEVATFVFDVQTGVRHYRRASGKKEAD